MGKEGAVPEDQRATRRTAPPRSGRRYCGYPRLSPVAGFGHRRGYPPDPSPAGGPPPTLYRAAGFATSPVAARAVSEQQALGIVL